MEAKKRKLKIDGKFHERKIVKKLLPCRLFTEEPCSENVLQSYVRQRLCRLASSSDKLDFEISAVRLKISYVIHEWDVRYSWMRLYDYVPLNDNVNWKKMWENIWNKNWEIKF